MTGYVYVRLVTFNSHYVCDGSSKHKQNTHSENSLNVDDVHTHVFAQKAKILDNHIFNLLWS
jgi:hypothetical protein